jgi:hypothetical protein
MRRPRRIGIPQRTPIFLGCEGESEQAYGQVLNDLLRDGGHPFHLEVVVLNPGAGDPIARLQRAKKEIARRGQLRAEFRFHAVLMDSDQVDNDTARRQQAEVLAREFETMIMWQAPCHEALLLRHFDGFAQHRPATSADAEAALRRVWPRYKKPMTKIQLAQQITLEAVRRAGAVEPQLSIFLRGLRLIP